MFQSATFTCLEMRFWMKIRLSVSIKRNSLTEMNLPVQETAENFYTNLPTKTNPDTGKGCSPQDPSSQAAAEFWLPSVTCIKSQWVALQARSLSYCETCISPSPHPFPALKPWRAAAHRTKEKAIEEQQGHTSAAFHTSLSLTSQASRSFFSLRQLNNCKLYTGWLSLWPSALVIIWDVWPGEKVSWQDWVEGLKK